MVKPKGNFIGLLGGSFDPPHKGHLEISQIALKKLKLKKVFWVVTKKNPLKNKPHFPLKKRILLCKNITKKYSKIEIKYIDDRINSSRFIDVIKFFRKRFSSQGFYLIIGADCLLTFHKWRSWKKIIKLCKLLVFSRKGFDLKSKKSIMVRYLYKNKVKFAKNKMINISSSDIRNKINT